jgi:type VI secretion system secreted protein VgrG
MTFKQMAVGNGAYQQFTPGRTFRLYRHEQQQFNRDYLITAVTHSGYQPKTFPRDADKAKMPGYYNDFVAIPSSVTFIPARKSPWPLVNGPQAAVVTGPSGEEIYTDKYGRVKVQFHWDRIGRRDENSSAWVRVSQVWAGGGYGAMFLPRVGQEVLVDFFHGDPSHPIVVGSLDNDIQKPPYSLPDSKTISTIRSASSKGGQGLNELRFEDKSGAEEIYIHGQKDLTVVVGKDKNQSVVNNETISVGNNRTTTVNNNLNETVGGQKRISVGSNSSETIGVNKQVSVGVAKSEIIGAAMQLEVGAAMSVSVGTARQVSVGGNLTESIGGNVSLSVGKDLSQSVGKNLQVTVGDNLTETVSKTRKLTAGKIVITAQDEIALKSGKASIIMKKNGDIRISGKNISVKGSGNVNIKGKKTMP